MSTSPFKISIEAINLIADISAMIERYAVWLEQNDAISKSTNAAESGPFIDFMLNEIFKTLKSHQGEPLDKVPNKLKEQHPEIMDFTWNVLIKLIENKNYTSKEIGYILGITDRMVRKHIAILKSAGIISRVGSNKNGHWEVVK